MPAEWYSGRIVDTSSSEATNAPTNDTRLATSGTALADADVVVVALHGRDQDPSYLLDNLVRPLDIDANISWVLPVAPGYSWYPDRADTGSAANTAAINSAIGRLDVVVDRISASTTAPIAVLGFSQGACLACEYAASRAERLAAVVALTGSLTGADPTSFSLTTFPGPPVAHFSAGDADPWVDVGRVLATASAFASAGANVIVDLAKDDADHRIRATEVAAVADLLEKLAAVPS